MSAEPRNNGVNTRKPIPPVEHQFKPGNPGRPKGSRNKLGEDFVAALAADFAEHGSKVIVDVRTDKPDVYLKVIAQVIPKEVHHTVEDYDDLSDEQLAERFAALASRLGGRGANGPGAGAAPGKGTLPH